MKEVKLVITVDADGKIHVKPEGTVGKECLELMKCIEKIQGFKVEETIMNDDMKNFDNKIVNTKHVGG